MKNEKKPHAEKEKSTVIKPTEDQKEATAKATDKAILLHPSKK